MALSLSGAGFDDLGPPRQYCKYMSVHRFAIIDPAAGMSGDMLLGALLDLGAPREWLAGLPARLGVSDAEIEIADAMRCGVRATKVTVRLHGATEGPGDVSEEPHSGGVHHQHHAHGAHRHVGELLAMIERAPLSDRVKDRASRAFRLLAEAEARVHGVTPSEVALHEVGAHDALIDIVGGIEGFEQLGVEAVYSRPVALGNGWVRAAHGVLPVPAPATALLAEGLSITADGPVEGEATTPTGAVLLRVLSSEVGKAPARWRPVAVGWGAGTRNPPGYPNAVRVTLADPEEAPAEAVTVMATDLDDLSPEYLEPLRAALVEAGALDVQSWATQMKKGRIGFRVEALVPVPAAAAVAQAFFRHSSTAGVRSWPVERLTLDRESWEMETAEGVQVRIKTVHGPGGPRVKAEYDDVVAFARRTGQPAHEVSRRFQEEALRRVRTAADLDGGADHDHQKE